MTRKDYVALARALHLAYGHTGSEMDEAQWRVDVNAVMEVCAADNPQFDRERFLKAVGESA